MTTNNDSSKQQPTPTLEELCYGIAYFLLPQYCFHSFAKLKELCINTPNAAGPFFYLMACQMKECEPNIEHGRSLKWYYENQNAVFEFLVMEYPTPPAIEVTQEMMMQKLDGKLNFVLAPHFSAIVHNARNGETSYFILGQSPIGGGTTLRSITKDGANCNLGPGPVAIYEEFLSELKKRLNN